MVVLNMAFSKKQGKDGKMPESWHIDEPQLKIVKKGVVKPGVVKLALSTEKPLQVAKTGGPSIRASSINSR